MSQRLAKEEMALLLPNTLSHYFTDDPEQLPEAARPAAGVDVLSRLGAMVRWLVELPRRRAVIDELSALSEHELSDIGLSRADVARVFDADFAAGNNSERLTARVQNGSVIRV